MSERRNPSWRGLLGSALLCCACAAGCGGTTAGEATTGGSPPAPVVPPVPPSPGATLDPGFNPPTNRIDVFFDAAQTSRQNGDALEGVLESLQPGDGVVIHAGTYTVNGRLGIVANGTEQQPISIEAAPGETVVITRDDENQNTVNIDQASYLTFAGIEITGGSIGLRIKQVDHLYVHDCHIHHTGDAGVTANSADTSYLYLVNNHVHDTSGFGEGFYIGANNAEYITHHTFIVGNYVHDTGDIQGDGIELKVGSYACVIADNVIENTNYPGILAYGNGGRAERNVIERNVIVNSSEAGIQVAADAIVRNNLVIGAADAALVSQPHQGVTPGNLTVVHNTFVNSGAAVRVSSWSAGGIVLANNAIYSDSGSGITGDTGAALLSGNVILSDLSGFEDVTLDGFGRDAMPSPASPLVGAGDPSYAVQDDLTGQERTGSLESGAVDRP